MRKIVYTLFIIIASAATTSARSLLDTFVSTLSAMDNYATEFTVTTTAENYSNVVTGSYFKQGGNTYVGTFDKEYYIGNDVKYEVNILSKEIIVDLPQISTHDLFLKPIGYFSSLAKQYKAEDTIYDNAKAVALTPKDKKRTDRVVIVADSDGLLPYKVIMKDGPQTATIVFEVVRGKAMPTFDRAKYPDFEVVDMR